MPYIPTDNRPLYDKKIEELADCLPSDPGTLNYCLTRLLWLHIRNSGLSYRILNSVIGTLNCVSLELYRRVAAPYEDAKISENGDVYTAKTEDGVI